jgi:hypothetical protein
LLKPQSLLSWVVNKHYYTLPFDEIKVSKEQLQWCPVEYLTFQIKNWMKKSQTLPGLVWPSIFAQFAEATAKEQQCRKLCTTAGPCLFLIG